MTYKCLMAIWVELGNVPDTFEEESIAVLACTGNELVKLSFSRKHVCITLIGGKIDGQSDKLFSYNRLRTVNNQLVNQWNTIRICEGSLCFIFQTQMVQKFDNLGTESWCFQRINQLRNHTCIIHLNPNFLIK